MQVVRVLGFALPFYKSPTLLLSLGLSLRVLYYLITQRPDVIHVSSPGKHLPATFCVSHSFLGGSLQCKLFRSSLDES